MNPTTAELAAQLELATQLASVESTIAGVQSVLDGHTSPAKRREAQMLLQEATATHQAILAQLAALQALVTSGGIAAAAPVAPEQPRWRRREISVNTVYGPKALTGYVLDPPGVWAVHRQIGYKGGITKKWRVSHMPTGGLSITGWGCASMNRAKELVAAIIAADPRYATVQDQEEFWTLNKETPISELAKSYQVLD